MPYIIDGHNLIPKVPGLNLGDIDDELQLIEMLQEFCRVREKQVEVYFDNAPPGSSRVRNFGRVVARFIPQQSNADQAIKQKLRRLGGEGKNWTVVSSDHEVRASAHSARAKSIRSEEFARELIQINAEGSHPTEAGEFVLSEDEIDEWMVLFDQTETDEGE